MLRKYPVELKDYGVVKDKLSSIEKFSDASQKCDVLITTGGVSVGDADHVKTALDNLGKIKFLERYLLNLEDLLHMVK